MSDLFRNFNLCYGLKHLVLDTRGNSLQMKDSYNLIFLGWMVVSLNVSAMLTLVTQDQDLSNIKVHMLSLVAA